MVNRVGAIPFDCRCKQGKWTWSVVVVGGDGDDDDDDVDDDYDRLTYMYKVIYKRTHYTSVKSLHDNSSTTQLNSWDDGVSMCVWCTCLSICFNTQTLRQMSRCKYP